MPVVSDEHLKLYTSIQNTYNPYALTPHSRGRKVEKRIIKYLQLSTCTGMSKAEEKLGSIWSQLLYAKRTLSPVRLVLKVTLFLLLRCTGVFLFLCIWGVLTRLEEIST